MNEVDMVLPNGVTMSVLKGPSLLVVEERSASNIVLMLPCKIEFSQAPVPLEIKIRRRSTNAFR